MHMFISLIYFETRHSKQTKQLSCICTLFTMHWFLIFLQNLLEIQMKNSPAVGWYCIEFVVVRLEAASDVSWPSWLWLLLDSSSIFIDGHSDDKSFKIFLWNIKITANNFLYHTAAFILSPFFVFYFFKIFFPIFKFAYMNASFLLWLLRFKNQSIFPQTSK